VISQGPTVSLPDRAAAVLIAWSFDVMDTPPREKPLDTDELQYILRFYGHLMSPFETGSNRYLLATFKLMKGRTDLPAQEEVRRSANTICRDMLPDDAEILERTRDGYEAFERRTTQRILQAHSGETIFNRYPRCGRAAKTPRAQQCRFYHNDWHTT
jgi:hypothetical protein